MKKTKLLGLGVAIMFSAAIFLSVFTQPWEISILIIAVCYFATPFITKKLKAMDKTGTA